MIFALLSAKLINDMIDVCGEGHDISLAPRGSDGNIASAIDSFDMDIVTLVGIVAALFVVISLSEPIADWLRLPYTVVLAVIGTLIGAAATVLVENDQVVTELAPSLEIFEFSIRANVFLYVLLPTLLFQVSLGLRAVP